MESTNADAWLAEETHIRTRVAPSGVASREYLREHSGNEFLNGINNGKTPPPPIAELMGFILVSADNGVVVFQGTPGPQHYNPSGMVHGGYAATLLDTAVGCAVHSMLPAGKGFTTLELKVNYIRGMSDKTGPVRAEGKVITLGGQVAVAEGRIIDASGKIYAHATTTCLIFAL
ncbi:MAG: PaaI family thioesterase [Burkholderiaceae bacterium]|nr:PaaI family thioesterase [Burkholderiaceae bacterium]